MGIINIFKPTIDINHIEYNSVNSNTVNVPIGKKPFIWFNNIQIDLVESFILDSSGFLPTVSIIFKDSYGYFNNLRFANDDDVVTIFIDSKDSLIRPIYIEFKITRFKRIEQTIFKINGIMNVNRMYLHKIESIRGTSYESIKKISSLSKLGFSSNVDDTSDLMTWINPGNSGLNFCTSIIERSYSNDSSFFWGFIDFYYNLNFIDVESQLKLNATEQLGISTSDINEIQSKLGLERQNEETMLYLSNDRMASGSSNYFESYKIFNNSTLISIKNGYSNKINYYDWENKDFLIFIENAITDNSDEYLILKSDDDEFLNENIKLLWEGKFNINNVHENYLYSKIQNESNINELNKIGIEIVLPIPNFNLYRFMKIYVLIVNQGIAVTNPMYNKKLSGDWLVTEIKYFLDNGELKQMVKLSRRNLGISQEEAVS